MKGKIAIALVALALLTMIGIADVPIVRGEETIRVEENDPSFDWSGWGWVNVQTGQGWQRSTGFSGDSVSVTFTGTGISLIHTVGPIYGTAQVGIDGVSYPDINMHQDNYYTEEIKTTIATDLTFDQHVLTITCAENINVDAVEIKIPSQTITSITPSSFTLKPGETTTLTATLTSNGTPLIGKTITLNASAGDVSPLSSVTNSDGQVTISYEAPSYETTASIAASFAGDASYASSSDNSSGVISLPHTSLTISPSGFSLAPGENENLTATLTFRGKPLEGKLITWYSSLGQIKILDRWSETDSSGQISAVFNAPAFYSPDVPPIRISASFVGEDNVYLGSSDNSFCTLLFAVLTFNKPEGTPLANTEIYYGYSSDQITNYLGLTDNEGKIELENSDLAGRPVYFRTSDGKYSGSFSIGSMGGEETVKLTEISEGEVSTIAWIIATIVIVAAVVVAIVFIKKRK